MEVCSGSGSVTKAMTPEFLTSISRGGRPIKIVSLDISDKFHTPTIQTDLMEWDFKAFCDANEGQIIHIHASPPCSPHSSSNTRKHLDTPYNRQQKALSKAMWGRVRDFIYYANESGPVGYSLENPWTSDVLKWLDEWYPNEPIFKHRTRGDYCAYGFLYQKKTLFITPEPINLKECPGNKKCHATYHKIATQRWCHIKGVEDLSKLEERYSMPLPLIRSIFSQVLDVSWNEEVDNLRPQGAGTTAQLGAGYTNHGEEEMSENTYNTPGYVTSYALHLLPKNVLNGEKVAWDPMSGNGAIVDELRKHGVNAVGSDIKQSAGWSSAPKDIRAKYLTGKLTRADLMVEYPECKMDKDFRDMDPPENIGCIVINPPFQKGALRLVINRSKHLGVPLIMLFPPFQFFTDVAHSIPEDRERAYHLNLCEIHHHVLPKPVTFTGDLKDAHAKVDWFKITYQVEGTKRRHAIKWLSYGEWDKHVKSWHLANPDVVTDLAAAMAETTIND